jgi:acetoin utilization protein AcuB
MLQSVTKESQVMKARDVMTEGPASVRSTAPLREAMAVLQSLSVRHLPVIDHSGELVGILTDRDIRKSRGPESSPAPSIDAAMSRLDLPVAQFMSKGVFTVGPEANVEEIADLMISQQIGAVPVVNSDGALVGIVSDANLTMFERLRNARRREDDPTPLR